jgi:hypothetical protein
MSHGDQTRMAAAQGRHHSSGQADSGEDAPQASYHDRRASITAPGPRGSRHAADFAKRYAEPLDYHAAQTMLDLGIPPEKIGDSDMEHGIRHAAFHPHRKEGGTVTPDSRIAG